ncbi:hypothetical protein [Leptolyngbya sp. FACHB-16]|nr:hypothetical protein [Leptolyngbya sp. FACHB-16]
MSCPKCGAVTYKSISGADICPSCGFGSAYMAQQAAKRQQAIDEFKRLTETKPDKSFVNGSWTLHIHYWARRTKNEGQYGVLLHQGAVVEPQQIGEVIETDLGKLKYYCHLEDEKPTWEPSGWNFADPSKIHSSLGKTVEEFAVNHMDNKTDYYKKLEDDEMR